MAHLAIRGHATRGEKVIEILEMLGGSNPNKYCAEYDSLYFYIDKRTNKIYYDWVRDCYEDENTLVFTLEQFEEKFPYKVGDKVSSKYLKNYEVSKMEWESANNRVIYKLQGMGWYSADELQPYKEETMEEPKELLIGFTKDSDGNWVLNTHKDYEIKEVDGKFMLLKKKPQYPQTYEECCDILDVEPYGRSAGYKSDLITAFRNLLICRDAYWKIAGDQMGLGKPWKPYWLNTEQDKFVLYTHNNVICLNRFVLGHNVLAFPTAEMRDDFYENFKGLIEMCKELL